MAAARSRGPAPGRRCARVGVELVRGLLPLVVATEPVERDAIVVELKAAQRGYLAPLFGAPDRVPRSRSGE